MASAKEIRTKIMSIKNTQKITNAMELVAASKMRKTQERMTASSPYACSIRTVINHLALANLEYKHPYLHQRKIKNIGYILISTDRGLCGSLNNNLFKTLLVQIKTLLEQDVKSNLAIIGAKGILFFQSMDINIVAQVKGIGDKPLLSDLIGLIKIMLDNYDKGLIDKLYIVSNKFKNTMSQIPTIIQLLPLSCTLETNIPTRPKFWDYIYEPDPKELLDTLLRRYIEAQVYQSVVENLASEQAARMVAMKTATDNSSNLIKELKLIYNKTRQASITQELTEIISGASAV